MGVSLLGYRPWEGGLRGSWASPWPIARMALRMVFRRKLFWALYGLALVNFFIFYSGIYLFSQLEDSLLQGTTDRTGGVRLFGMIPIRNVKMLLDELRDKLYLSGSAETFQNFFWYQGYIVMAVLAFAGSLLVGNDYQHGSLPFYLSKPLGRWHYLTGKLLAVALFINMMTTLPALILFVETGLLTDWSYFPAHARAFWGILGYGAILTACLSLLVVATASGLRKTIPMIMVWVALLFFCRLFGRVLVDVLQMTKEWRLIDLWNSLYIVGSSALGVAPRLGGRTPGPQPETWQAALILTSVCVLCLMYLNRRIRAVEIVP